MQGLAVALRPATSGEVAETMNALLTAVFSLFVKSRNYQWHICGSPFRNSHRLLEEHGDQLYSMLQPIVLQLRALGKTVFGPLGHLPTRPVLVDDDVDHKSAWSILLKLRDDNRALLPILRRAKVGCELRGDEENARLIEEWLHDANCRANELGETCDYPEPSWP